MKVCLSLDLSHHQCLSSRKQITSNFSKNLGEKGHHVPTVGIETGTVTVEISVKFPQHLKMVCHTVGPVSIPGIHPRNLKSTYHRDTHTFIAAELTINRK